MSDLMNQSMSDGGDCRTAPATPGLLKEMAPVLNSDDGSKSVLIQAHQFLLPQRANSVL